MKKSKKLKIEDVLDIEAFVIRKGDIGAFCYNDSIAKEYEKIRKRSNNDLIKIKEFLIKNKKEINVEKLALTLVVRFKKCMEEIESLLEYEKNEGDPQSYINHLLSYNEKKEKFIQSDKHIREIAKDMEETCVYFVNYLNKKNRLKIEVFNSEEVLKNKKNNKRNDKILKRIDKNLVSKYNDSNGLENILNIVKNEDIYEVFPDFDMGQSILIIKQANESLRKDSVQYLKQAPGTVQEIKDVSKKILGENVYEKLEQFTAEDLIDYAKYIDINKLLLIYAYRIQEKLEKGDIENIAFYKEMLDKVKNNIDNDAKIFYKIENTENEDNEKKEEDTSETIQYSAHELKECLNRIIENKYFSKEDIEKKRIELINGNISLTEVSVPEIKLLKLTNAEIEKLMENNLENFMSGTKLLNYDLNQIMEKLNDSNINKQEVVISLYNNKQISNEDIISLYEKEIIGRDSFEKFSENLDIFSEIDINEINEDYINLKTQKDNKEKLSKLNAKIEIYKILNIEGKTKAEKEEIANEIMYDIAETFEDEEDMLFYYDKGIITLGVLADWGGEEPIERLYNRKNSTTDSKKSIDLDNIEKLYSVRKISREFLENKILNAELSLEQLTEYMQKGYISEDNIINIFEEKDLYREDARKLEEVGVISQTAYELIKNRDIQKIEDRVGHKFGEMGHSGEITEDQMECIISLPQISKKSDMRKPKKEKSKDNLGSGSGKTNKIIDPAIRYEYLASLKRRIPDVDYDELDRKNPFYHYEFYIIQEECLGNVPRGDAIVIAERFFKDREKRNEYATDNATYIMRYEDYLILQGKQREQNLAQKRKVIKEVDGAIYAVNHRVGNKYTNGSWAAKVLKAIGKAKAGKSFKNLTPNEARREIVNWLHTLYTDEELMDVLKFAEEIDRGMYTCEEKNGIFRRVNSLGDVSDDTEAR